MTKNILIIPGSVDCNRGDQALVWTAIDLIEATCGEGVRIGLLTEEEDVARSVCSAQTFRRGYAFYRMILDNPNRAVQGQRASFRHGRWGTIRVMLRAAFDFLHYGLVLRLAPWPWAVRPLLSPSKRETYRRMREADAVVIKGGGFMYAYRSPTYAYYLWYVCYHTRLAQRLGVPVAILPNSFGPFETAFSRRFIARLLDRCALVATRENVSQKELDRLIPGKAKPFPDMAFLLRVGPEDRAWARAELESQGVRTDGRAVGITMRPWRFPGHPDPAAAYEAYLNAMAQFIDYLREQGFQPVLFAHVQGPGSHEMDRLALDACRKRFADDPPVLVDGDYDCVQVKALYSHLGYMVGTRFHSCIFAMAQAIPTLAIGYQGYKASGIMSDMELGAFSVDIEHLTAKALIERFSLLVERREKAVEHGRAYVEKASGRLAELGPLLAAAIGCGDAS